MWNPYQFRRREHVVRPGPADWKSVAGGRPHLGFLFHSGTGGGGHEEGGLPGPPVCLRRQPQPGENMSPKTCPDRREGAPCGGTPSDLNFIRRSEHEATDQTVTV